MIEYKEKLKNQNEQLQVELSDTKLLQSISSELFSEGNIQALYERITDAAVQIMHSQYASMQMLHTEGDNPGKLQLIAYRKFNPQAVKFWEWVYPESGSTCGEALRTGKRVIVSDVKKCEFMQGTEDQAVYLQTGINSVQTTPLYSRSGKLVGMISTHWNEPHQPTEWELGLLDVLARQAADLIEQRHYERKLRKSEEKYRTLFENMNEGFFLAQIICDESGKPVDYLHLAANPALDKVIGLKSDEIIGKTRREVQLPPSPWIDIFGKVALTGQSTAFEGFSEGLDRHFLIRAFSPKLGQFACLIEDITNRKKMEEELIKQQQLLLEAEREKNETLQNAIEVKDEFLSVISHEFRTPLNVINTAIQTLNFIYSQEMTDKIKEYIEIIRRNTNRQLRLVNNLLDITRIDAGRIKIHKKNIDIVFLTRAITESVCDFALQKGISITFKSAFSSKTIGIDDEKYERIILNLLSNAIKFTPKGKSIAVSIRSIKGRICVDVKDEGIGIPQSKIDLIFEKFGQVDSSLSRQAEGTGMGLSLVRKFTEALNGAVNVKSKVGKGTTFTVSLPNETVIEEYEEKSIVDLMLDNRLVQAFNIEFSDIYL